LKSLGSRGAATFRAIKAAGIKLIYRYGYDKMSIRELARAVGLEGGSVYYYVNNKQEFLFHLIREILERNLARLDTKLAGIDDPSERMQVIISQLVRYHVNGPEQMSICYSEFRSLTPQNCTVIRQITRALRERVETTIKRGVEAGQFRVTNIPMMSLVIVNVCSTADRYYDSNGLLSLDEQLPLDEVIERLIEATLLALGAVPPVEGMIDSCLSTN
jgi:AcrR family transcriptional regulator